MRRDVETARATYRGVSALVEIRDHPDAEGYLEVKLYIDPPSPGLDREAYTRMVKRPGLPPRQERPCRELLRGGESRCNGGGYDGCACGPYSVADYRAMANNADSAARRRSP